MRLRARKGQVLMLMTLLLPVLVGMVGLALDTSNLVAHRDAAQNAADLAALGGSNDLPASSIRARASALRMAASNGHTNGLHGIAVTVTTPYQGDSTRVEVQVQDTVQIIFMRLLGFRRFVVGAHAVASSGAPMQAIYAGGACGGSAPNGMSWNVTSGTITGQIHTNGSLSITGSGSTFSGPETYVCTASVNSSGGSIPPPVKTSAVTAPVPFTMSSFTNSCTMNFSGNVNLSGNGTWWVNNVATSHQLRRGTYCATGSITITASGSGQVTFVAGTTVTLNGTWTLTPNTNNVLIYADGTGNSSLGMSNSSWSGIIDAPHGMVSLTNSGSSMLSGSILASAVSVIGAGLQINATGMTIPKPVLVQ